MKSCYDKKSLNRNFCACDKVFGLVPLPSSSLHAQFSDPYEVEKKFTDSNYIIRTHDRRNLEFVILTRSGDAAVASVSICSRTSENHVSEDGLVENGGVVPSALYFSETVRDVCVCMCVHAFARASVCVIKHQKHH